MGDGRRQRGRVGQQGPDVQAQVIAEQAGLNSARVIHAQGPEALDALARTGQVPHWPT